ncbi:hydroxyacylglutathione hydrolase [Moraxella macacae 0408225]|uniref:Hydroxyacylglutathione hydrolase n=1 Tax=Moraxella macacae 0408225 TaxID=1230338 RepID=L2F6Q6_9GAMM|nr:hydroxyacylglutathione hydrolase [Moraxella macacae]ELA08118.1 hydroxyacylglutathione hydrolase [Moraxella macacae 0408225]
MLDITPIAAFDTNYIWLLINRDKQEAIAIDTGDATVVQNFLQQNQIKLQAIWITHHHHDHTGGVLQLVKQNPDVQIFAHKNHGLTDKIAQKNLTLIDENIPITAWEYAVKVWQTFGHTDSHLSFLLQVGNKQVGNKIHVFCGDTLFAAGCGRVFTGTIEQLFASFQRFNALATDTLFYPAHEYTLQNLEFANFILPNDNNIKQALKNYAQLQKINKPTLPTTLANERQINVFLQALNPSDDLSLAVQQKTNISDNQPLTIFAALRKLKNNF